MLISFKLTNSTNVFSFINQLPSSAALNNASINLIRICKPQNKELHFNFDILFLNQY